MSNFATVEDIEALFRPLSESERIRAEELLPVISDSLRQEAYKRGRDLDEMIKENAFLENVAKSVTVDVAARVLLTSTTAEPMTQFSQSAMGYTVSGSYLVPGGGLFIKESELKRLGIKRQRIGGIELYGNQGSDNPTNC